MVDASELDTISPAPPEGVEPVVPAKKPGFFGTPAGRIVMMVGGVIVVLIICGIIAVVSLGALAVGSLGSLTGGPAATGTPPVPAVTETATVEASAGIPPAVPAIENIAIFSPRNPFEPVEFPADSKTAANGETESGTLTLEDIVTEDGVRKAVLTLDGKTYKLANGERLGDTPWQVQTVYAGSVRMLYGDDAITLTLGQGISSK